MRSSIFVVLLCGLSACAVIEEKHLDVAAAFTPIETPANSGRVQHGIVTVRQVDSRSDIIVLPPSVQHVIWRLDASELPVVSVTQPTPAKPVKQFAEIKSPRGPRVRDNWPLLEEDVDFDTEIGSLDMCYRETPCSPGDDCGDYSPCEDPEKYDCFVKKMGEYCLKKDQ